MGIEVYRLIDANDDERGVALVCTTSGRFLNLPVGTFDETDDASAFLEWSYSHPEYGDPRALSPERLEEAVRRWDAGRPPEDRP